MTTTILSNNLKELRSRRSWTQVHVADQLAVSREMYSKYETGRAEPPIPALKRIASLYSLSLDILINVDLSKVDLDQLVELEGNRVLLPIKVSPDNENAIEIVTHKATAGYLSGYADPEFIEQLDTLRIPFLGEDKLRAFPISGDSMLPLQDGSYVVGKYLEDISNYKDGHTYIVVTQDEGIVFKRVFKDKENSKQLILFSDNEEYAPYSVQLSDIVEMWQFACSITLDEPNHQSPSIRQVIHLLQKIDRKNI